MAIDEFRLDYKAGRLVFFVGAGAPLHSKAPSAQSVIDFAAQIFLPQDEYFARDRDLVLKAKSVSSGNFPGIQPEVFYENLLTV